MGMGTPAVTCCGDAEHAEGLGLISLRSSSLIKRLSHGSIASSLTFSFQLIFHPFTATLGGRQVTL